jgi:hypothetical protein
MISASDSFVAPDVLMSYEQRRQIIAYTDDELINCIRSGAYWCFNDYAKLLFYDERLNVVRWIFTVGMIVEATDEHDDPNDDPDEVIDKSIPIIAARRDDRILIITTDKGNKHMFVISKIVDMVSTGRESEVFEILCEMDLIKYHTHNAFNLGYREHRIIDSYNSWYGKMGVACKLFDPEVIDLNLYYGFESVLTWYDEIL